jgi:hypothetical protein
MLELGALLSHGAGKVVRDSKMVRGQANPEYWTQFMAGYDPPLPKVPHVYEKFVNQLRASGVNTVRTGTKTHIMALTDKSIDWPRQTGRLNGTCGHSGCFEAH